MIEKLRDFYRAELPAAERAELRAELQSGFESGVDKQELVKTAIRPVLNMGQKRYRVIDELLALKEAAATIERTPYFNALMHLID